MSGLEFHGDWSRILWDENHPEEGDPTCLCSYCGALIPATDSAGEGNICVRMFDQEGGKEARFCERCFRTYFRAGNTPGDEPPGADESTDLGPCCACESTPARTICCLDFEGPEGTEGWGCVVCGLPARGAVAVMCESCIEQGVEPRFIVGGRYAADKVRVPLEGYERRPFDHRLERHPEHTNMDSHTNGREPC